MPSISRLKLANLSEKTSEKIIFFATGKVCLLKKPYVSIG